MMNNLEEIKAKFKNCEYLENSPIQIQKKDGTIENTTTILLLFDKCNITLHYKTREWIERNLIGCWGNQQVRCTGQSNRIFKNLNKLMKKIKEI